MNEHRITDDYDVEHEDWLHQLAVSSAVGLVGRCWEDEDERRDAIVAAVEELRLDERDGAYVREVLEDLV